MGHFLPSNHSSKANTLTMSAVQETAFQEKIDAGLKIEAKEVPTPSAIIPPDNSLLVASRLAPPIVVALMSPIVSIVVTIDINNIRIIAPGTKSIPY